MHTDEHLLASAVSGDADALGELIARHGASVRSRLAGRIAKRWQPVLTLDDVMQDAYLEALLNVPRLKPRGLDAFLHWLTSVAECSLVDAIRMLEADKRGGNRRRLSADPHSESGWIGFITAVGRSPSSSAAVSEADAALRAAVRRLPEPQRTVVQLLDLQGRPAPEVAATLGRTVGAVYLLRLRAHRKLCDLMGTSAAYLSRRA